MRSSSDGFTLIELLIVLVLIATLSAIAIPQMMGTREKVILATMKHDLRNLATAEEAYYADWQTYAGSLAALTVNYKISTNITITIDSATATGWGAESSHTQVSKTCSLSISKSVTRGYPTCP